jgi:sigma-B regulation protein RsbU (phosphoserine phosphatase)
MTTGRIPDGAVRPALQLTYVLLNFLTGEVRFSCAGHPPPIVVRKSGKPEFLDSSGPIIGLDLGQPSEVGSSLLEPGDRLYIYTDGPKRSDGPER